MCSNKKAQISVFIIIGLLLVITLALVFSFQEISLAKIGKKAPLINSQSSLQEYVNTCLEQITEKELQKLALQGGVYNPVFFLYYNQTKVAYSCIAEPNIASCTETYLTKQDIEQELGIVITEKFNQCFDSSLFDRQGFFVIAGEKKVNVVISAEETFVTLKFPIILKKKEISIESDTFRTSIKLPFGLLFDLSRDIINEETKEGFDMLSFMKKSNDILIQRKKIYPDTFFLIIKKDFRYQFALQGKNTVVEGPIGSSKNKNVVNNNINNNVNNNNVDNDLGCCYNAYDNSCYQNVKKDNCIAKEGIYDTSLNCECELQNKVIQNNIIETEQLCNGKECKSCKQYHDTNGKIIKGIKNNLESWCVYDQNFFGIATVGSRSAMHYCYDGNEYVDECRDYREEFCVQKDLFFIDKKSMTQAECKINRWQSCISCNDKNCCDDVEIRDCIWEDLTTEQKCVPLIKPGFRFWEGNGLSVCLQANQKKECNGFTCPQEWIDDTAKLCAMSGDCGNYYNVNNEYTFQGYFQSDFLKKSSILSLNNQLDNKEDNNNNNKDKQQNNKEKLLLEGKIYGKKTFDENIISYSKLINYQAEILSAILSYFEEMNKISIIDFLNPFREKPVLHIIDISFCSVWDNPIGGDYCNKCTANKFQSCSEYFCKSLGKSCIYDYNLGNPNCFSAVFSGLRPTIENITISAPYLLKRETFNVNNISFNNFVVDKALEQYDLITLSVNTNTETVCKLDFTPLQKYNDAAAFYVGDSTYGKEHNLTLRVPSQIKVPEKVLDLFNFTTVQEIQKFLLQPKDVVSHYQEKYAHALDLYKTYRGDDLSVQLNPIAEQLQGYFSQFDEQVDLAKELLSISFSKFENNEYLLYLHCADKAGNELDKDYTINFIISNSTEDNKTAIILGFIPANESKIAVNTIEQNVLLFANEPVNCKYDTINKAYENMSNSFICKSGEYNYNSYASGSYECSTKMNLNVSQYVNQYYISCADNPVISKKYLFSIIKDDIIAINGIKPTIYLNISQDNKITFVLPILSQGNAIFSVTNNDFMLGYYTDEFKQCNLEDEFEHKLNITNCKKVIQPELGLYYCEEKIDLNKFLAINSSGKNKYDFAIICSDTLRKQNINNESITYVLEKSRKLEIIDYTPKEEVHDSIVTIGISTSISDDISCSINKELSLTGAIMTKIDKNNFQLSVVAKKGYSIFVVSCKDSYGNSVEKEIGVIRT